MEPCEEIKNKVPLTSSLPSLAPKFDSARHKGMFFLDTRGACFLCLKETTSTANNDTTNGNVHCLDNIFRYLSMNANSILKMQENVNLITENRNEDKCSFSVLLCDSCSLQTNKLVTLIRQVELATMLANYQLQIFQKILKESEKYDEEMFRLRLVQKKIGLAYSHDQPIEACLLKNLRNETNKKCYQKLDAMLPKVKLNRLELEHVESSRNAQVTSAKDNDMDVATNFQNKVGKSCSKISEQLVNNVLSECCQKSRLSRSRFITNRYNCRVCSNTSSKKFVHQSVILRHLANVHPEKFFPRKLLQFENLTEDIFRLCSSQVLKVEANQCTFCSYRVIGFQQLKYHLIQQHYSVIDEKLTGLCNKVVKNIAMGYEPFEVLTIEKQREKRIPFYHCSMPRNNTERSIKELGKSENSYQFTEDGKEDVQELVPISPVSTSTLSTHQLITNTCTNNFQRYGKGYQCLVCLKVLGQGVYRKHLVNTHPETIFATAKLPHTSQIMFIECCRRVLAVETNKAARQEGVTLMQAPIACLICQRKRCGPYNLKYHFTIEHYEIFKAKIIQSQKNACSDVQEYKLKLKSNSRRALLLCQKKCPVTASQESKVVRRRAPRFLKCNRSGCGETFGFSIALWRHKKYVCSKKKMKRKPLATTVGVASHKIGHQHLNTVVNKQEVENYSVESTNSTNSQSKADLFKILHDRWKMRKLKRLTNCSSNATVLESPQKAASPHSPRHNNTFQERASPTLSSNNRDTKEGNLFDDRTFENVVSSAEPITMTGGITVVQTKSAIATSPPSLRQMDEPLSSSASLSSSSASNATSSTAFNSSTNTPSVKQLLLDICPSNKNEKGSRHFICTFCNIYTTSNVWFYRKHVVNSHPEKFLSNAKLPHLSNETFMKCCRYVLMLEKTEAATQHQNQHSNSKSDAVSCRFCSRVLCNAYEFRYHCILEHSSIFEEKLVQLQRNESEESLKEKLETQSSLLKNRKYQCIKVVRKKSRRIANRFVCGGCNETFSSRLILWSHKKEPCPNIEKSSGNILPVKCAKNLGATS